jgi:hypothetical protein
MVSDLLAARRSGCYRAGRVQMESQKAGFAGSL